MGNNLFRFGSPLDISQGGFRCGSLHSTDAQMSTPQAAAAVHGIRGCVHQDRLFSRCSR
uniref:Uncharacterized protein n=1 Tax=Parascaris equorum TaxID=6256 RepID=A0A914RGN8_PAREQ